MTLQNCVRGLRKARVNGKSTTWKKEEAVSESDDGYRPELPDWGVYLRWPVEGNEWIHPDDVTLAERLIPSERVFHRSRWDGEFYWLHYGEAQVRVRPTMWIQVPSLDLAVGQQVELLANLGENDPGVFRIQDIFYSQKRNQIEYYLRRGDLKLERRFSREDLKPTHVRHHLRTGYYEHAPSKSNPPDDLDTLNVGELFGD